MWQVILIKKPRVNDFPDGYFPRKFYYKSYARELVKEVEEKGGQAVVEPVREPVKR